MLALVLAAGPTAAWANDSLDPSPEQLPNAIKVKGPRPKSNPDALPPAATSLPADLNNLAAPAPWPYPPTLPR
ncbi:hypothetical protein AAF134_12410 [Synechococcus lacustris Tous-12m]